MLECNIKFSIIIPIYNVQKYLPKCLDSLLNQTLTDIEIICINDGSTDNSLQILKNYANKDNRIKIITQQNQGVSVARNTGIDNATGEYVLFVDADDWLELNTCEILSQSIVNKTFDLITFNAWIVKQNQAQRGFLKNKSNLINSEMWAICYNRTFLNQNKIRFPKNIKIAEDHVFKCQAIFGTDNILILDNYLYFYLADREYSASKVSSVIKDDIDTFYYMLSQDWFNNATIEKQTAITDYWLKLVGGTLFNTKSDYIDINVLKNYIAKIEELKTERHYKLKNLKNLKIFIRLIEWRIFPIYKNIIRPIGKYCIVLPYRRIKQILRGKNV